MFVDFIIITGVGDDLPRAVPVSFHGAAVTHSKISPGAVPHTLDLLGCLAWIIQTHNRC